MSMRSPVVIARKDYSNQGSYSHGIQRAKFEALDFWMFGGDRTTILKVRAHKMEGVFRVYNGPVEKIEIGEFVLNMPPKCKEENCRFPMFVIFSDRHCWFHAIESLKKWDRENVKFEN